MDVFFLPLKGNTLLPVSRVSLPARCVAAHKGLLWEQSRLQQYDAESIKKNNVGWSDIVICCRFII